MIIRKAKDDDLFQIMEILKKWNMAPVKATSDIPNPERESIVIENSFVAENEGHIIGVCSYIHISSDTAETASLAVDPGFKGTGIGYSLQMARFSEMKKKGYRWVHTETDRKETIDWYIRKFGYHIVGKTPKKHTFSLPDVNEWTILRLDLNTIEGLKEV